jgi:UDP-GlcNAc:undecaprenyl-phosphate GlcNAc-1-phosphate transferase
MLGGVAVWAGVLVAAAVVAPRSLTTFNVFLLGSLAFVLGLIDDILQLKPSTKLLGQIFVGCVAVVLGLQLNWTGSPALDAMISLMWFVGITNAFNLLDNMDGLCAGIAGIAALAFSFSALSGSQPTTLALTAAVAGASAGFLIYNFNPASVFMGDSGSLFLGGMLAVIGLLGGRQGQTEVLSALTVPVLIMLIPIFDTTFVTVSRKLSGRAASRGGRDHTSHRLVALGFSERQAVLLLYVLAAAGGATAIAVRRAGFQEAGVVLALLLVTLVLLGIQLARVG